MLEINPTIKDEPGIYFLTRKTPDGELKSYIGQAGGIRKENGKEVHVKQGVLTRLAQHLQNRSQHIDLSLKAHGLYSEENPYGYKIEVIYYKPEQLNEKEQYWIEYYLKNNIILLNKNAGSQGEGRTKIAEYKPRKGYREGIEQGRKKLAQELKHIIEKHLIISLKNPNNKTSQKQFDKFNQLLNVSNEETAQLEK